MFISSDSFYVEVKSAAEADGRVAAVAVAHGKQPPLDAPSLARLINAAQWPLLRDELLALARFYPNIPDRSVLVARA